MTDHRPPSARQRIGGRWAISLRGYLVMCALVVSGSLMAGATALESTGVPGPPALFIGAQCVMLGVLLGAAHLTVFRNRAASPLPIWAVVALGAVIGLARIPCGAAIRMADGLPPLDADLILSTTVTTILVAVLMPALAYALATRAWYARERTGLIARDVEIQAQQLRAAGAIDAAREMLLDTVDARLATSRASAAALRRRDAPDAAEMADLLMRTAHESVRPLSHELWGERPREYPSVTWRQVVACETRRHPLPILVPSLGFMIIAVPLTARAAGVAAALVIAIVALASIAIMFRIGRVAIRRNLLSPITAIAVAAVLTAVPIVLAGAVFFSLNASAIFPIIVLLLLLLVAGGAPAAANETADSVIAELQALIVAGEVEQLALEREHDALRRELAAHLHGTLQPRLVSASHVVREAALAGNAESLEAAMRDAELALGRTEPVPAGPGTLAQVVNAARHDWARVLAVTWDVQITGTGAARASAVADVLRESLANAVVHGHAAAATVELHEHDGALMLTITDDGLGPQHGVRGLGSEVLDHATARRWDLHPRSTGTGSVLTATIGSSDV